MLVANPWATEQCNEILIRPYQKSDDIVISYYIVDFNPSLHTLTKARVGKSDVASTFSLTSGTNLL